jgi:two-component system sensor histidine kinase DesK
LPEDVDALFGWVVREGATNVVRHARATECRITWQWADGVARLEVSDDGAGAAGVARPAGGGLAGLRERVAAAGGRFEARPTGSGFRMAVDVPLATGRPAAPVVVP